MPRIAIVRPTGFRLECPEIGTWLMQLAYRLAADGIEAVSLNEQNWRVPMNRNRAVMEARKAKCDYMLMLDPDAAPDRYVRMRDGGYVGHMRPFWDEAWPMIQQRPDTVLAAPAVGPYPDRLVNVWGERDGHLARLSHGAAMLRGWLPMGAVGTHLMLIGMGVFDRIDQPYFHDLYTDSTETHVHQTQDIFFCGKVRRAKMDILVNFSCWAGHWQNSIVDPPGMEGPAQGEDVRN